MTDTIEVDPDSADVVTPERVDYYSWGGDEIEFVEIERKDIDPPPEDPAPAATQKDTVLADVDLPKSGKRGPIGTNEAAYLKAVALEFSEYGRILTQAAQPLIPQAEGVTARSLRWEVHGKGTRQVALKIFVGNSARPEVAIRSVLYGRKAIYAKRKALRFQVGGKTVFARGVKGTKAQDWFDEAWRKTTPQRLSMEQRLSVQTNEDMINVGDIAGATKRTSAQSLSKRK